MFRGEPIVTERHETELYGKYDYSLLSAGDVVSKMAPELQAGLFSLRLEDGKIDCTQPALQWNMPWIFAAKAPERACVMWFKIMFSKFGMLPIWCRQNCWKVAVKPRTIEELFSLKELQMRLGVPSKCGIETRETVFGDYGGYFYINSQEEGFDMLDRIRAEVAACISPDIPIHLKRGCTEFEYAFGPSDQWKKPTVQEHKNEDTIRGCFLSPAIDSLQPKHLQNYICQKWIHWAWDRGDPTVTKFNKGEPLFPYGVKYERELEPTEENAKTEEI